MRRAMRAIWLILTVLAVAFSIFYLRTWAPFMGIAGNSMKPALNPGDLVLVEKVSPREIKEGDIIIFEVPPLVRETYSYPLIVAHRVIKINIKDEAITFNTQGDNLGGPDPFTVRPVDLRGGIGKQIPHLGFLLLFLQSKQGIISIAVILLLISIGSYSQEIDQVKRNIQREAFSPVLEEQREIRQALSGFASAMAEYAKHLESHTEAVQSMANTAKLSEETNRNLVENTKRLAEVVGKLDEKLTKGG